MSGGIMKSFCFASSAMRVHFLLRGEGEGEDRDVGKLLKKKHNRLFMKLKTNVLRFNFKLLFELKSR